MSDKPKFLSFQGAMYVRADLFVQPASVNYKCGFDAETVAKVNFSESTWFEVGDNGYKAWPLTDRLVKVVALGQEPEPIKMVLDLDVNEALDKISSVIARTELADNLKSPVVINATNLTVNGVDIAADIKRIVIEQLKKELQPGGILNQ